MLIMFVSRWHRLDVKFATTRNAHRVNYELDDNNNNSDNDSDNDNCRRRSQAKFQMS